MPTNGTSFDLGGFLNDAFQGAKSLVSGELGSSYYDQTPSDSFSKGLISASNPVVPGQPRQLGNALPPIAGSLATVTKRKNSPAQLPVRYNTGVGFVAPTPQKGDVKKEVSADGSEVHYYPTNNASQNAPAPFTPQQQADANLAAGKDINGNPVQQAPYNPQTAQQTATTPFNYATATLAQMTQNDPIVANLVSQIQKYQQQASAAPFTGQGGPGEKGAESGVGAYNQQTTNSLLTGASTALSSYLQSKGLNLQAANSLAGVTAPQAYGPTNVPFYPGQGYGNPAIGQFSANGSIAGGAQGLGNFQGQVGVGQDVAQQNAFLGSAQATGANLQKLITDNNINPQAFTPLNGAIQAAAQYTSNVPYQEFAGQISDFVTKIAPILGGPAGTTTDYKTHLASQILNSWASGQSINDVISYFLNQAKQNIQGYSQGGGATGGTAFGNTFQ